MSISPFNCSKDEDNYSIQGAFMLLNMGGGGVTNSFAQKFTPKYLRENDKSFLQLTSLATDDGWLEFSSAGIDAATFSTRFAQSLGFLDGYQLRLVKDKTDPKGGRHQHYQLYWKGIFVEGGHLSLHSRNGQVKTAHARIIENLNFAVNNPIAELLALGTALTDQKLAIASFVGTLPKGELVLTSLNGDYLKENYRLAWYFDIYGRGATEANRVYIDALSGKVIKRISLINSCFGHKHPEEKDNSSLSTNSITESGSYKPFVAATFNSLYPRGNPTPSFEVEPNGATGSKLIKNTNVNQSLQTRRDQNGNANSILFNGADPDAVWDDPDLTNSTLNWGNNEQNATLAHWVAYRSYQYFLNRFNVNGTDGQGGIGRILISSNFLLGPVWFPSRRLMIVGPVNGTILSTVDVVGHEYGHGVSNLLVAGWQPGADPSSMNEGFSDIIGTAMERELIPTGGPNEKWNWQIGDNIVLLRDMADPHRPNFRGDRLPQTYQEPGFWDFNNNDPHTNAGVLDKWFNTLVDGTGPNGQVITPISSFDDAMSVVYWGLDYFIYGDYNYPNAANALRNAAGALFGECSPQQRAVAAAWGAVGIPTSYICSPDCNYKAANILPTGSVACNQPMLLSAGCTGGPGNTNTFTCQGVSYYFSGPNVPFNSGPNSSITVTSPSSAGNYTYYVMLAKPSASCYPATTAFNINVSCGSPPSNACDFSSGPRRVGSWNGLEVQIRSISGKNVLVTAIVGSANDKYYPRGDNFWDSFTKDGGVDGLRSCLNAGDTGYGGLGFPGNISPPNGYQQGAESDGAVYFQQGGTQPPNCDFTISASTANATCNQTGVLLTASCNGANCDGLSYSWTGGQSGQTASFNAGSSNGSTTYTVTVSRSGCSNKTASGSINVSGCGGGTPPSGGAACQGFNSVCSGNGQEIQYVTLNVATAGSYPLTITYTSHEKAVDAQVVVGNNTTSIHYDQTTYGVYTTASTGSVYLNQGPNTIGLSSGSAGGYICFTNVCAGNGSGRVGVSEPTESGSSLVVLPNPSRGMVTVRFRLGVGEAGRLSVVNLQGNELQSRAVVGTGNEQIERLELSNQASGLYLIRLDGHQSGSKTAKLILER